MSNLRVACVFGQSGAASGLLPVLKEGGNEGWWIKTQAYGEATGTLQFEKLIFDSCDHTFGEDDAIRWLSNSDADIVLLGSDATRHVEKRVTRAAKALGIPSIMFVDFWSNYSARFEDEKGRSVPDAVAVLDEKMASSLERIAIARERLYVTGSPALEQALPYADLDPAQIRKLRIASDVSPDSVCVLFVSTPTDLSDYGNNLIDARPHSLLPALQDLANALGRCERLTNRTIQLIIRPHPRENASSFSAINFGRVKVRVETIRTGLDWVALSDLVVGLDTILLIEAMMARRPVLCLSYVRPLIPEVQSWAESSGGLVVAQEELATAVTSMFSAKPKVSQFEHRSYLESIAKGATKNIVSLVNQIAMGK